MSITNKQPNTMNTLPNIIVRPPNFTKRAIMRRPRIMLGLHSVITWRPPSTRTMPRGNTRKCTAKDAHAILGTDCQPVSFRFLMCAIWIRPSRERTERFDALVLPQLGPATISATG
jgi:hypothetical protein